MLFKRRLSQEHTGKRGSLVTRVLGIINEQCGGGIMSAIDFYFDVGTTTGKHGEKRVVITFNGKFLPHIRGSQLRKKVQKKGTFLVPRRHKTAS